MDPTATVERLIDLLEDPTDNAEDIREAVTDLANWVSRGNALPFLDRPRLIRLLQAIAAVV